MHTNGLSALGRMSYSAHLALYPVFGGSFFFLVSSFLKSSNEKAIQSEIDAMPKARPVDPDNFNPFTAIPFHNNPEMRYRYADMKLFRYVNKENHMNLQDYAYKGFHHSYDHDNQMQHVYNWVSNTPADDARISASHTLKA